MSNPYHVVLNRQSSGERGAFVKRGIQIYGDGDDGNDGVDSNDGNDSNDGDDAETTELNKTITKWQRETTSTLI